MKKKVVEILHGYFIRPEYGTFEEAADEIEGLKYKMAREVLDEYLSDCMTSGMAYIEIPETLVKVYNWLSQQEVK